MIHNTWHGEQSMKTKRTWKDWLIIIGILLAFLLIGSGIPFLFC